MANYELVIGSKFQPFSYERYIKPYQLYNEAYTEQENALNTLSVTSELLRERALAEKANGQEWAGKYLDYLDSLKAQADALSKEGLNVNSRRALSNLKTAYGTTVAPVQKAIEAQAALAKIAASQNPALRMQYGEMPTIDALIADPTKTQIGYSGATVEESAMKLAAQAAARNTSESFKAFKTYWMRQLQTAGYDQATINRFLEDAESIPELKAITDKVSAQFGNFEGLSERQKDIMKGEILTGILKGAGYKEVVDYKQNPIAVEQWKARQAAAQYGNNLLRGTLPIDVHHLLSPNQEGARGANRIKGLIKMLGLSPSLSGRYGVKGADFSGLIRSGVAQIAGPSGTIDLEDSRIVNSEGTSTFKWFTDKGNIMKKARFIAQGKTRNDQIALGKIYDNIVKEVKDLVNFSSDKMNVSDISRGLKRVQAGLGSYTMGAFRLPFGDNNKVLTDWALPLLSQEGEETAIKEIDSFDRAGNVKSTGKTIKKDTFLDKEGNLKGSPMFFLPPAANSGGLIMRFNGKSYLIPKEKLGSIIGETYSIDVPTLTEYNNLKKELIKAYGEDAYYNSPSGQKIEQILEHSGGSLVRNVASAVGLEYLANPSKVNEPIK